MKNDHTSSSNVNLKEAKAMRLTIFIPLVPSPVSHIAAYHYARAKQLQSRGHVSSTICDRHVDAWLAAKNEAE